MADHSIWGLLWVRKLVFKSNGNLTHRVIFHPLHQSLNLACKSPEKERKSVLLRNSARIFHPKGPELEVSMVLSPLHELAETLRLKDKKIRACSGE